MRDVTKPEVLERFRGEWEKYLQQLEAAPADDLGADLDAEILGTMSDDQKAKLVDMRASSRRLREEDGKYGTCVVSPRTRGFRRPHDVAWGRVMYLAR